MIMIIPLKNSMKQLDHI